MNDTTRLLADLTSWYWWLTAVALGIALNLTSAYLKPLVDRWYDGRSHEHQVKARSQNAKVNDLAQSLLQSLPLLQIELAEELRLHVEGGIIMIMSLLSMFAALYKLSNPPTRPSDLIATILLLLAWISSFVIARRLLARAQEKRRVLTVVRIKLEAAQGG